MKSEITSRIFKIKEKDDFLNSTLEIFKYQARNNPVYKLYLNLLGSKYNTPEHIEDIPFLPTGFFRNHKILTGNKPVKMIFQSSGTTGISTSLHYVSDLTLYEKSFYSAFSLFYGDPANYIIYALLPSYIERKNSSLVYMVKYLIQKTKNNLSLFYNNDYKTFLKKIEDGKSQGRKLLMIGVSYALLDLAEACKPDFSGVVVMETGGMKGRRKELIRSEFHSLLKKKFNIKEIHSEYGMTELLSQAYSKGNGIFRCPPWMKILIRDPQDPFCVTTDAGKSGGINIIDLANINSCSFVATDDLGKLYEDGSFEVLGRLDNSDIRGCNLLIE